MSAYKCSIFGGVSTPCGSSASSHVRIGDLLVPHSNDYEQGIKGKSLKTYDQIMYSAPWKATARAPRVRRAQHKHFSLTYVQSCLTHPRQRPSTVFRIHKWPYIESVADVGRLIWSLIGRSVSGTLVVCICLGGSIGMPATRRHPSELHPPVQGC